MTRGRPRGALAVLALVAVATACVRSGRPPTKGGPVPARSEAIVVAAFNFAESRLLAELYGRALRASGLPVEVLGGVASREVMEPALEQGEVDIVPEYLGTALRFLSTRPEEKVWGRKETHARLSRTLESRGIAALEFAPVEDRNEIVVARSTARRLDLERLSDLKGRSRSLVFGGPPECPTRPLCLRGLESIYGLRFESFLPLDAGGPLTVAALDSGEIDVGVLFTTDPVIREEDFVVLEDDRNMQPPENVVPVVRREILEEHGKGLVRALNTVSARLKTQDLVRLNARVILQEEDAGVVAQRWLEAEGLGEDEP